MLLKWKIYWPVFSVLWRSATSAASELSVPLCLQQCCMKLCVIGRGEDGSFALILLQMSIEMSNYNFYYQLVYEYKYFLKTPLKTQYE